MTIVTVEIDLAKNVFAVDGADESGKATLLHPRVPRAKLLGLWWPRTIAMEACTGAHHWARLFAGHGHTVKLMAPKLVGALPHKRQARQEGFGTPWDVATSADSALSQGVRQTRLQCQLP